MGRIDLERLSKEELIELVLRLQRPDKTSRTSSKPPSTDRKDRREQSRPGGAKPGHEGHSRVLAEDPQSTIDHHPEVCPCCQAALPADLPSEIVSQHDRIDLPVIKPVVERHRRLAVQCPACGTRVVAAVPEVARGTPFGPRVHAAATYLKTFQALSYERLQGTFLDLFGLSISQGGLMNMLRRAQDRFAPGRDAALAALRRAVVVASDETGVRIEGSNAFHWIFRCAEAVVHRAVPTRGAVVVRDTMDGHRPAVWLSDRYGAQQNHADRQQTCLAHLARDVAYALDASDDPLPLRLKLWLRKAFALFDAMASLAESTIASKRRALGRSLADILSAAPACDLARALRAKFERARDQLLTFADWKGLVEPHNNGCERGLRPAVIQRKVTNGYRAMWAAEGEADVRTVVATARVGPDANVFGIILNTVQA